MSIDSFSIPPPPSWETSMLYRFYGLCLTTMIRLTIKFPGIFCIKPGNYLANFSPLPFLKILSYYCPPPPPFYNTFFENTQFQFIMAPPPHTHTFENIMTCVTLLLLPPPPPPNVIIPPTIKHGREVNM